MVYGLDDRYDWVYQVEPIPIPPVCFAPTTSKKQPDPNHPPPEQVLYHLNRSPVAQFFSTIGYGGERSVSATLFGGCGLGISMGAVARVCNYLKFLWYCATVMKMRRLWSTIGEWFVWPTVGLISPAGDGGLGGIGNEFGRTVRTDRPCARAFR